MRVEVQDAAKHDSMHSHLLGPCDDPRVKASADKMKRLRHVQKRAKLHNKLRSYRFEGRIASKLDSSATRECGQAAPDDVSTHSTAEKSMSYAVTEHAASCRAHVSVVETVSCTAFELV